MAIVKVKDKKRYGVPVITTIGKIHPSNEDGTFEVEDEAANKLIAGDDSFCLLEDFVETKPPAVEELKKKSEESKPIELHELSAEEIAELEELEKEQVNQLQSTEIQKSESAGEVLKKVEEAFEKTKEDELNEFKAALQLLKRAELEEKCKDFPGGEWRGKNKEQLVEYLISKLA